jgi:flagellar basal body-associated protein FliL
MRKLSIVIALLVMLAAASPAAAAQSPVVGDCVAHGQLTQTYSAGQLKTALNTMSAAVKEYTNCSDVIQRALLNDIQGVHPTKSGSGSGGGSFLPTPVIVLIVLLALAGVTFGAIAIRRRSEAAEASKGGADPPGEQ